MELEFNGEGRLVLKNVTDEAWAYIEEERAKADDSWSFFLSHENYGGTVYCNATMYEDKTEIVRILGELIEKHGMTLSKPAEMLLYSWKEHVNSCTSCREWNAQERLLEQKNKKLKSVIREGCKTCRYFAGKWETSDDFIGYCTAGEKPVELDESPLSPEYGEDRKGTHFWGTKYYPHAKCAYLNE